MLRQTHFHVALNGFHFAQSQMTANLLLQCCYLLQCSCGYFCSSVKQQLTMTT